MATRAKSVCRTVSCGKAIDAPGYCDAHKREKTGWNRTNGDKTSSQRGYGYRWQKLRESILRRDGYLCQVCMIKLATEVDHIVSKAKSGSDDPANLQSICSPCHKEKTVNDAKR